MLPPQLPSPGQPGGPPDLRASYTVHISATAPQQIGTKSSEGPTWITSSGFRLQALLSTLYSMPPGRIHFDQPSLADRRFNVALRLPTEEDQGSMHQRIARALEKQVGVTIRTFARAEPVYIVTVVNPSKLPTQQGSHLGGASSTVVEISAKRSEIETTDQHALNDLLQQRISDKRLRTGIGLDSIDMEGGIDELCRILEEGVGRPVLDRTGYGGSLELSIRRGGLDRDEFFHQIEAKYGIAITPAEATVDQVVVSAAPPTR